MTTVHLEDAPSSYWYNEYRDAVRAAGREPLSFDAWLADDAHSPRFRALFGHHDERTAAEAEEDG